MARKKPAPKKKARRHRPGKRERDRRDSLGMLMKDGEGVAHPAVRSVLQEVGGVSARELNAVIRQATEVAAKAAIEGNMLDVQRFMRFIGSLARIQATDPENQTLIQVNVNQHSDQSESPRSLDDLTEVDRRSAYRICSDQEMAAIESACQRLAGIEST